MNNERLCDHTLFMRSILVCFEQGLVSKHESRVWCSLFWRRRPHEAIRRIQLPNVHGQSHCWFSAAFSWNATQIPLQGPEDESFSEDKQRSVSVMSAQTCFMSHLKAWVTACSTVLLSPECHVSRFYRWKFVLGGSPECQCLILTTGKGKKKHCWKMWRRPKMSECTSTFKVSKKIDVFLQLMFSAIDFTQPFEWTKAKPTKQRNRFQMWTATCLKAINWSIWLSVQQITWFCLRSAHFAWDGSCFWMKAGHLRQFTDPDKCYTLCQTRTLGQTSFGANLCNDNRLSDPLSLTGQWDRVTVAIALLIWILLVMIPNLLNSCLKPQNSVFAKYCLLVTN